MQFVRSLVSCALFQCLAWTEEFEMYLHWRDAPRQQLVINVDHERLRTTEIIVCIALGDERFNQLCVYQSGAR